VPKWGTLTRTGVRVPGAGCLTIGKDRSINAGGERSPWRHARNDLPAVPAIDSEVRIGGEYDRIGECLAHPYKAGIGEAHWDVRVLLHEMQDTIELVSEFEREDNGAAAKKRAEGGPTPRPEKVERLRCRTSSGGVRGTRSRDPPPALRAGAR